jgi:hypothetical protein
MLQSFFCVRTPPTVWFGRCPTARSPGQNAVGPAKVDTFCETFTKLRSLYKGDTLYIHKLPTLLIWLIHLREEANWYFWLTRL